MARHINWYLNGWVFDNVEQKGQVRRVLVYRGAYYGFSLSDKGLRSLKAGYLLLTLATYAVFFLLSMNGSQGGETFYSGVPGMMTIIPFIYLGMGVFCFVFTKVKMTYRAYYASIKRIIYSSRVAIVLLGLCTMGEVLFIAIHASDPDFHLNVELQRLFGVLFCTAATGVMLFLHKKFPISIVST